MRRLKTYPALASVNLPASADVLGVHDRGPEQAPSVVVSYDDADEHKVERRYVVLQSGDAIPPGAQFVDSWRRNGCGPQMSGIFCLFELVDEMPADLPADAYPHWRVLQAAGFTLRADRAWLAPAGHLSTEQIIAVATLQEHGYGSVVNA